MTKPVEEIVPREVPENIRPLLNQFAQILEEAVNFGSNVMDWDKYPKIDGDHNVPPTMLLRHFLDLIDSISILTYKGSGDTMKLQARAALEIVLYMEYLFEKDTINRSMAFLVEDSIRLIKATKKLIPNNEAGKAQHKKFEAEGVLAGIRSMKDFSEAENFIQSKERLLAMPQYKKAHDEYKRLIRKGERNPKWYRYFNGPKNIEELAAYLKQGTLYDLIYRQWSGSVHGSDIYLGRLSSNSEGIIHITQIRFIKDVQEVVTWALMLSIKMFKAYIEGRIPEKKSLLQEWYKEQSSVLNKLQAKKWIIID